MACLLSQLLSGAILKPYGRKINGLLVPPLDSKAFYRSFENNREQSGNPPSNGPGISPDRAIFFNGGNGSPD